MEREFQGEIIFRKTRTKQTRTNKSIKAHVLDIFFTNLEILVLGQRIKRLIIILGLRERDKMNKKDKTDRHGRLGKLKKLGQHT